MPNGMQSLRLAEVNCFSNRLLLRTVHPHVYRRHRRHLLLLFFISNAHPAICVPYLSRTRQPEWNWRSFRRALLNRAFHLFALLSPETEIVFINSYFLRDYVENKTLQQIIYDCNNCVNMSGCVKSRGNAVRKKYFSFSLSLTRKILVESKCI